MADCTERAVYTVTDIEIETECTVCGETIENDDFSLILCDSCCDDLNIDRCFGECDVRFIGKEEPWKDVDVNKLYCENEMQEFYWLGNDKPTYCPVCGYKIAE